MGNNIQLINSLLFGVVFWIWIWGPYARYGCFNGFGILLHAQLSYLGTRDTTFAFCFFSLSCIAYMGSLLLQSQVLQPGAASGGSES